MSSHGEKKLIHDYDNGYLLWRTDSYGLELEVLVGGSAMYVFTMELSPEESTLYLEQGKEYLDRLVRDVARHTPKYADRKTPNRARE